MFNIKNFDLNDEKIDLSLNSLFAILEFFIIN